MTFYLYIPTLFQHNNNDVQVSLRLKKSTILIIAYGCKILYQKGHRRNLFLFGRVCDYEILLSSELIVLSYMLRKHLVLQQKIYS